MQDIFLTRTAQLAYVVLPATAAWCEAEGTVTNSERRVQRVRKAALEPPEGARDDIEIIVEIARRLGHDWTYASSEAVWDELRCLSPMHAGMSYRRLEELGGIQWPCPSEDRLEPSWLHGRLWAEDPAERGRPAPFSVVVDEPPGRRGRRRVPAAAHDRPPARLLQHRRPVGWLRLAAALRRDHRPVARGRRSASAIEPGEQVRVSSRRGTLIAPARIDPALRPGLVFMTMHFPDEIDTNPLTIEAIDPKSGTAEFKASAVRVEKLQPLAAAGG